MISKRHRVTAMLAASAMLLLLGPPKTLRSYPTTAYYTHFFNDAGEQIGSSYSNECTSEYQEWGQTSSNWMMWEKDCGAPYVCQMSSWGSNGAPGIYDNMASSRQCTF